MIETYLQQWIDQAPVMAASILAVLFMVGVAAVLGFRQRARIDEAALQRLAAAESASVERASIQTHGKSAVARLSGDKLMIARVMGADISTRVSPLASTRFRFRNGTFSVEFADTGFPALELAVDETPPWLAQLAAGDAQ
jgi:hypothetical protein